MPDASQPMPVGQTLPRFAIGCGPTIMFVMAILAGAILGHLSPANGAILGRFTDYTVVILVSLLIFEVRFVAIHLNRSIIRFLAIAWILNFLLIPTIGFAIASSFLKDQPLFFAGLMIYFMAPCTDWFLGFTRLAKGDTALGAILLPINMLTQLLLYPVYISLFVNGVTAVDAPPIGVTMLQWFLYPFIIAIACRQVLERVLAPSLFQRLLRSIGYTIPLIIALLIVEIFAANIGLIIKHAPIFGIMLFAIFLFFVATFFLGELTSKIVGLPYPQHALLTMTTAARNAPMMLGITAIAMPEQPLIYAAIVIGMLVEFPHLTALRQILLRSRHQRRYHSQLSKPCLGKQREINMRNVSGRSGPPQPL
ncbi:arsenic resistance protein (plasmid) [Nitrobacteraceae bacterium UC4446_H13]